MFLVVGGAWALSWCFPRIRGDVPRGGILIHDLKAFSPHTRGCSECWGLKPKEDTVFPAYAGMFLKSCISGSPGLGFPRIRGDVPHIWVSVIGRQAFSPHTRGCSAFSSAPQHSYYVFPAYAGMFLEHVFDSSILNSFPRIRGDVPAKGELGLNLLPFSPHTRGCSCQG